MPAKPRDGWPMAETMVRCWMAGREEPIDETMTKDNVVARNGQRMVGCDGKGPTWLERRKRVFLFSATTKRWNGAGWQLGRGGRRKDDGDTAAAGNVRIVSKEEEEEERGRGQAWHPDWALPRGEEKGKRWVTQRKTLVCGHQGRDLIAREAPRR